MLGSGQGNSLGDIIFAGNTPLEVPANIFFNIRTEFLDFGGRILMEVRPITAMPPPLTI